MSNYTLTSFNAGAAAWPSDAGQSHAWPRPTAAPPSGPQSLAGQSSSVAAAAAGIGFHTREQRLRRTSSQGSVGAEEPALSSLRTRMPVTASGDGFNPAAASRPDSMTNLLGNRADGTRVNAQGVVRLVSDASTKVAGPLYNGNETSKDNELHHDTANHHHHLVESSTLTVFGVIQSQLSRVLPRFQAVGEVISCENGGANWFFITYATRLQAEMALTLNGSVIGDVMIGVKWRAAADNSSKSGRLLLRDSGVPVNDKKQRCRIDSSPTSWHEHLPACSASNFRFEGAAIRLQLVTR